MRTTVFWRALFDLEALGFSPGVPNLFLTMYPFIILTNEHVPLQHFNT